MKIRTTITVYDPEVRDLLNRLGPYRRSVFIRLAVEEFTKTDKGLRVASSLSNAGNIKKKKGIDLDEIL